MYNKTANVSVPQGNFSLSGGYTAPNGLRQTDGYGIGRLLHEGWQRLTYAYNHLMTERLTPGQITKAGLRAKQMESLRTHLRLQQDNDQRVQVVAQFYQQLLPFQQRNITDISQDVFESLTSICGEEIAAYVIDNNEVAALTAQLQKLRLQTQTKQIANLKADLPNCLTNHEVTIRVGEFFDELLPFQRGDLKTISAAVFTAVSETAGPRVAAYVAENSQMAELKGQLQNSFRNGLSYRDLVPRIAGVRSISAEEDLKQLLAAKAERAQWTRAHKWEYKFKEGTTDRLALLASQCQGETCPPDLARMQLLTEIYPPRLVEAVGGINRLLEIPVLSNGEYQVGSTGYIDTITPREMRHPVMRGIDVFGRPFLAICYVERGREQVEVMFQRYTGEPWNWVSGLAYGSPRIHSNGGVAGIDYRPNSDNSDFYSDDVAYAGKILSGSVHERRWHYTRNEQGLAVQGQHLEDSERPQLSLCKR